jgi:hypothetical protein
MPQRYIKTIALERRLILGHQKHKEVEKDLAKRRAGYWGEYFLYNYLKELPQQKYFILHDLQLKIENVTFQIDFLLLSHFLNLIIEAKNILGTLTFDSTFKQLLRKNDDGSEDVFEDPRTQAQYHRMMLNRWLREHGIDHQPNDYLVFFSNVNKTNLKILPGDKSDFSRICKGRELFLKIDGFEKTYHQKNCTEINEVGQLLLSSHSPKQIDIMDEYGLTKKDIRTGVRCPECSFIPMIYARGQFSCPACKCKTNDTLPEALQDYSHLYKPTITNSEFRDFIQISSPNIALKELRSLHLNSAGNTRNRQYFIESE